MERAAFHQKIGGAPPCAPPYPIVGEEEMEKIIFTFTAQAISAAMAVAAAFCVLTGLVEVSLPRVVWLADLLVTLMLLAVTAKIYLTAKQNALQ
jgi:hypothetical protein